MENINPPPLEPPIIQEPDHFAGGDSLHVERRFRAVAWGSHFGRGDAGFLRFDGIPVFGRILIEEEEVAEDPLVPPVPIQNVDQDQHMDFEFISSDEEEESDEEYDEEEDLRAQSPLESHVADAPVAVAAVEEEPLPTSEHLLTEFSEATPSSAQGSKKRPREDD